MSLEIALRMVSCRLSLFPWLGPLALLTFSAPSLLAFCPSHHNELIDYAFGEADGIGEFADRGAAMEESLDVDALLGPESGEEHQFKHSMRPARTSLVAAQEAARLYLDYYMGLAVTFAKEKPPRKMLVGRYLGRILHAVQDRKHRWSSCGPDSNLENPPSLTSSNALCSDDRNHGCLREGEGNHGLISNCRRPTGILRMIRNAPISFENLCTLFAPGSANFQIRTDADKDAVLMEFRIAEDESRQLLGDFLSRVRGSPAN